MIKGFYFLFLVISVSAHAQKLMSVDEAIELALKNNYDIQLVKNTSESYAIDADYVNAAFLPTVNGTASKVWNKNAQQQNFTDGRKRKASVVSQNLNAAVNLNWTLFDGLKMFATKERIEQLKEYGELATRTQVVNSIAAVITNYYNIVSEKQLMRAIDTLMVISEKRVTLADKKFSVGLGSKPELLQAKVDLNAQKAAKLVQETLIVQLTEQLNQLTGVPINSNYEVTDSIPINVGLNYGALSTGIEKTNPGLLAFNKSIDVAALELKERKAERWPVVKFASAYDFSKLNNGSVVNPEFQPLYSLNKGFNYGFSAVMPILNGFNTRRLIRQASLSIDYFKINYAAERSKVELGLSNSFKDYQHQIKALQLEEENITLAKENVFIALERFRKGASTYIELRNAQISLQDAYNRLITARYNTKVAETELLRLRGNISSSAPLP
ncbi:MAG: TolC family protein [Flavitalea sp.]